MEQVIQRSNGHQEVVNMSKNTSSGSKTSFLEQSNGAETKPLSAKKQERLRHILAESDLWIIRRRDQIALFKDLLATLEKKLSFKFTKQDTESLASSMMKSWSKCQRKNYATLKLVLKDS